ncbi:hypothetical protein SASPL_155139 [Salvia splendens]|uniref:Uncharacterized protein n=1 Tax=Salvia splendens TaxID=180675 RepID=A0A8X8YZ28_SALSN|nr:hypothetical protein SASPL_155139 [Salvia splendens]
MDSSMKNWFNGSFCRFRQRRFRRHASPQTPPFQIHGQNRIRNRKFHRFIQTVAKVEPKKKVRWADDVVDSPANRRAWGKAAESDGNNDENLEALPEIWQAMYREILHERHVLNY